MTGIPVPELDVARCDGCGSCVEVCPERVLEMFDDRPRLMADADCVYCGRCEEACPAGAITLVYEIVIGGDG